MSVIVKERRFICSDLKRNNNKYWHCRIEQENSSYIVRTHYGRVGDTRSTADFGPFPDLSSAEREFEKRIKSKLKPSRTREPYREVEFLGGPKVITKDLDAKSAIQVDSTTQELLDYLAAANIHKITSCTSIEVNSNGIFSTPLGVVSLDTVNKARNALASLAKSWKDFDEKGINDPDFDRKVEDYIMLIPQNIGRRKLKIKNLFPNYEKLLEQNDVLDSLEASIQGLEVPKTEVSTKATISLLQCSKERKAISDSFYSTLGNYPYKITEIYQISIDSMVAGWQEFGSKKTNIKRLWHGTRDAHLLSIMYNGFIIPSASSSFVNGRAYGNGVYGADLSKKSCGYLSHGSRKFMFYCDFALGNYYHHKGWNYGRSFPVDGYDSTFAEGDGSLAMNEYIVYDTRQINPIYLLEIK